MDIKTSQHSNSSYQFNALLGKEVVMAKVHLRLVQGSFIIWESSTCNKEIYDHMTPQILYYTKIKGKT